MRMTLKRKLLEIWGWAGSISLLIAYGLGTHYDIEEPRIIDAMNIFGGAGVAAVCLAKKTWQPFFVETSWALIGISSFILNSLDKEDK